LTFRNFFLAGQKKVPKGQFLQGSRNWQKCSALIWWLVLEH
jgi:hypothetical protein